MTKCLGTTLMYHLTCFGLAGSPGKIQNLCLTGHSDSSRQGWLQGQDTVGPIGTWPVLFSEVMLGNEKAPLGGGSLCWLFLCSEERNSFCIRMLLCGIRRHSAVELAVHQAL